MEKKSEEEKKMADKTFVLVGATGSGKSYTGNTIYKHLTGGLAPFVVSDSVKSCSDSFHEAFYPERGITLYDTPGFGDTKFDEKAIVRVLGELGERLYHPDNKGKKDIDCFNLPVKFTPRAQTLQNDLEMLAQVFGKAAYKSLIILLIDFRNRSFEELMEGLDQSPATFSEYLKERGATKLDRNNFVRWDNEAPIPGQEQELMLKLEGQPKYVYSPKLEDAVKAAQKQFVSLEEAMRQEGIEIGELIEEAVKLLSQLDPVLIIRGAKDLANDGWYTCVQKVLKGVKATIDDVMRLAELFGSGKLMTSETFGEILKKAKVIADTSRIAFALIRLCDKFGTRQVFLYIFAQIRTKVFG